MATLFYSAEKEKLQQQAEHRRRSARLYSLSPEEAAQELDHHCLYCGGLMVPTLHTFEVGDKPRQMWIFSDNHGCRPEHKHNQTQAVKAAQERIDQERQWQMARLRSAGLVGWLGRATFDGFKERQDWPGAMECRARAMKYCDNLISGQIFPSQNWLILYGNYGNGKSMLAAAIVRAALDNGWSKCYFRAWPQYLERLKASWHREKKQVISEDDDPQETETDIINELQNGRLIVIDDLDKKPGTDWTRSTLYSALNHRYNAELPTILTFNYGPAQADPKAHGRLILEEYLGRAVLDRMIGATYDIIEFTGPSYRSGVELAV